MSLEKIGDVLVAQRDLDGGLESYRASRVIAERLAKADASNSGWQRTLLVSHIKVGGVLDAMGDTNAAIAAYEASLAIAQSLEHFMVDAIRGT